LASERGYGVEMYKIVIKTRDKTWVKKRGKSKEHLENMAVALSLKKPNWIIYVVKEEYNVS